MWPPVDVHNAVTATNGFHLDYFILVKLIEAVVVVVVVYFGALSFCSPCMGRNVKPWWPNEVVLFFTR